jgi:hypothetical protein
LRIILEDKEKLRARFTVRPSDVPALLQQMDQLAIEALRAQVEVGMVDVVLDPGAPKAETISHLVRLAPAKGHLIWTNVPDKWRPLIGDVWGPVRGDHLLMRGIKQALDPGNLFSPGRFIGGL